jgi:hypothetical protein
VLQHDAGTIDVMLTEEMSEPLLSQCDARVPGQVRMFRLASIYRETVP